MSDKQVFAILYDFDRTLSPKNMQEYAFISDIGMEPDEFWDLCNNTMYENNMDQILSYMYVMLEVAKGKMLITRETLQNLGKDVELFDGVKTWFDRVNKYVEERGMMPEHYIISSGLKEIIEGTSIANEFKKIYAAEFYYDNHGEPCWPAMAVNYSSKTQFLYRINKGVLDVTDNENLNEFMPEEERRVPFRNMVYIGDGYTDVPCMKLVRQNGGHSIAVFEEKKEIANDLILHGRVDLALEPDYTVGSKLEKAVFAIIDQAAAANKTTEMHVKSMKRALSHRKQCKD